MKMLCFHEWIGPFIMPCIILHTFIASTTTSTSWHQGLLPQAPPSLHNSISKHCESDVVLPIGVQPFRRLLNISAFLSRFRILCVRFSSNVPQKLLVHAGSNVRPRILTKNATITTTPCYSILCHIRRTRKKSTV